MIFGAMVYFNYRDTRVKELVLLTSRPVSSHRGKADLSDSEFVRASLYGNAILGGMIGYLATSAFISTLYYPTFWIMMALAVALRNTTQGYAASQLHVLQASNMPRVASWMSPRPVS